MVSQKVRVEKILPVFIYVRQEYFAVQRYSLSAASDLHFVKRL